MRKIWGVGLKKITILITLLLITGCAKYVTDKTINDIVATEQHVEFTITFESPPMSDTNYEYFLILAASDNIKIVDPTVHPYFFVPADDFSGHETEISQDYVDYDQQGDLQEVYDHYFSTWVNIYKCENAAKIHQYTGPFTVSANHYAYTYADLSYSYTIAGNSLKFYIVRPAFDPLYFTFAAVDNTDGNSVLKDAIDQLVEVNFVVNSELPGDDLDDGVSSGLEILSYKVRMYKI